MDKEQKEKLALIENYLKKQELNLDIFKSISYKPLENSASIYNGFNKHNQSYDSITSCL